MLIRAVLFVLILVFLYYVYTRSEHFGYCPCDSKKDFNIHPTVINPFHWPYSATNCVCKLTHMNAPDHVLYTN